MRYCCDQALHEGRPLPTQPAKLPLMRPPYGRMGAGVCKAISMHLGIAVLWVRLFFLATTCLFGAGLIAYIFLWMALPVGDPIQQTYIIAGKRSPWQAPLSRGNMPYGTYPVSPEYQSFTAPQDGPHPQPPSFEDTTACNDGTHGDTQSSSESLEQTLKKAPKPALLALAGLMLLSICFVMFAGGVERTLIVPLLLGLVGIGVSWLRFNAEEGQLWTMLGGIAIIFAAYALCVSSCMHFDAFSMIRILCAGLALLIGALLAIVPWIMALIRDLGTERASKEREEERADMTAHLHDGVLQTLALIQLHADDQQTVFSLARSQERELREWLYQERTTSDRSVNAGLKEIAAHVEDTHGKPIEVVTVGDARPSAQTDALLDATQQALINAVAHGGEPISVYCEASSKHDEKFDRSNFVKNVILDNILPGDIYIKSRELHFNNDASRVVFLIRTTQETEISVFDIIQNFFPDKSKDFVINVNESDIALVKEVRPNVDIKDLEKLARSINDTLLSEFYFNAIIGIGTCVTGIKELAHSFKEAQVALEVGKVFDTEKTIISYENLGIARLIYQLPTTLCDMFLKEVFKRGSIESLDQETLFTIQKFFENNLNVSETSRKLFVHRNTLVYRLEKIKKLTGLDLREFDDAIVFKVALMVNKYLASSPVKY